MEGTFKTEAEAVAYIEKQTLHGTLELLQDGRTLKRYKASFTDGTKYLWDIHKGEGAFSVHRLPPRKPFYTPKEGAYGC
jgi:hypothetical protein